MVTGDKTQTVIEAQTVIEGGDCTAVTAVPDSGYKFAGWTGDYTGTDNPLTITNVTSDMTITANFTITEYQEITLSPASTEQAPGSELRLTVSYDVSDADNTLSSLGIRIHFDSTRLEYNGFENFFATNKLADPQLQDDVDNKDSDENTDKLIVLSYADPFNESWPNEALPLDLVTFAFTVKNDAPEGSTDVNISKITGHTGYEFVGNGCTVNITPYTVTFTPGAHGSVTGTTTQTITEGGDCSAVTAVPDAGYQFAGWTGDYTGTDNPLTITNVTNDMNITADYYYRQFRYWRKYRTLRLCGSKPWARPGIHHHP